MPFQIGSPQTREELDTRAAGLRRTLVADILGRRADRHVPTPQVFYVDQIDPLSRIKPHFHGVDQFQLVVRGSGRIGTHDVEGGCFHYADAYQPYGPIIAGESGLAYLTIRARHDSGVDYMPDGAARRKGRPRRPQLFGAVDLESADARVIAGPLDGGLKVTFEVIAADRTLGVRADEVSDGLIGVVLDGQVVDRGTKYARWSCFALAAGDEAVLVAGPGDADVLLFQFPVVAS